MWGGVERVGMCQGRESGCVCGGEGCVFGGEVGRKTEGRMVGGREREEEGAWESRKNG